MGTNSAWGTAIEIVVNAVASVIIAPVIITSVNITPGRSAAADWNHFGAMIMIMTTAFRMPEPCVAMLSL